MFPHYSYPPKVVTGLIGALVLGHRRNFRRDACSAVPLLNPPLQVIGWENILQSGRCVITVNHYCRPGFAAQWFALAISSVVPVDIHWIMTGELTYPGKWYAPLGMAVSQFVLKRGARVYGFTAMPPMPPRPRDVEARAAAVRAVLDYVKHLPNPVVGLAPEGGDQGGGQLTMPASGLGRFALLLAAQGLKFSPVGVYESNGKLYLDFGQTYDLIVPRHLTSEQKDRSASRIIMERIATCLPFGLRGEFE